MYNVAEDPLCIHNLATDAKYSATKHALKEQAFRELREQDDPRMFGRGEIFDEYPYADPGGRNFYERFTRGEKMRAGWVNPSDFEKEPLDEPQ